MLSHLVLMNRLGNAVSSFWWPGVRPCWTGFCSSGKMMPASSFCLTKTNVCRIKGDYSKTGPLQNRSTLKCPCWCSGHTNSSCRATRGLFSAYGSRSILHIYFDCDIHIPTTNSKPPAENNKTSFSCKSVKSSLLATLHTDMWCYENPMKKYQRLFILSFLSVRSKML